MEEWRDIKGFEGKYMVSNLGRVKSLKRTVWNKGRGYYITVSEKILKTFDNGYGYLQVALSKDGKDKEYYVHRLVATAFLENPMGYTEVNHIDEDKTNNCVDNLEFCSRSYNINHGARNKKAGKKIAEKKSKPVFSVNKESGLIMWWQSAKEAERCTGIAQQSICACCKGKVKSAGGHIWFYADDNE